MLEHAPNVGAAVPFTLAELSVMAPGPEAPRAAQRKRQKRVHNTRDDIVRGSIWVSQKPGEALTAVVCEPPPEGPATVGERCSLRQVKSGRKSSVLVQGLLDDYRLATEEEARAARQHISFVAESSRLATEDAAAYAAADLQGQLAAWLREKQLYSAAEIVAGGRFTDEASVSKIAEDLFDWRLLPDDLRNRLDVVPPNHPSHDFSTPEEIAKMPPVDQPFAEGCGGCGALPGDYEAREPCDPPKPVGLLVNAEFRQAFNDAVVLLPSPEDREALARLVERERAAVAHLGAVVASAIDERAALLGLLRKADAEATKAVGPLFKGRGL